MFFYRLLVWPTKDLACLLQLLRYSILACLVLDCLALFWLYDFHFYVMLHSLECCLVVLFDSLMEELLN